MWRVRFLSHVCSLSLTPVDAHIEISSMRKMSLFQEWYLSITYIHSLDTCEYKFKTHATLDWSKSNIRVTNTPGKRLLWESVSTDSMDCSIPKKSFLLVASSHLLLWNNHLFFAILTADTEVAPCNTSNYCLRHSVTVKLYTSKCCKQTSHAGCTLVR